MTVCREASSPANAARSATVLPAPTSPVLTPSAVSLMHQRIRATARELRDRPAGDRVQPAPSGTLARLSTPAQPLPPGDSDTRTRPDRRVIVLRRARR